MSEQEQELTELNALIRAEIMLGRDPYDTMPYTVGKRDGLERVLALDRALRP